MQTVEINERAMTCALDYTVGEEARKDIVALYDLLHAAERTGREEGAASEQARINDYWHAQLEQIEREAFDAGYEVGHAIAASDEQPDVDYPCDVEPTTYYEGDSGDETLYDELNEQPHWTPPELRPSLPAQQQQDCNALKPAHLTNPFAWSPGPSVDDQVQAAQRAWDAAYKRS